MYKRLLCPAAGRTRQFWVTFMTMRLRWPSTLPPSADRPWWSAIPYPPYWDVHEQPQGRTDHGYFGAAEPLEALYGDVEPHLAQESVARLGRQSLASVAQPLTQAAWRTVPSTYILCEEDMAIPLPLQEAMAARAGRTVRLRSGHSPFLSQPAERGGAPSNVSSRRASASARCC
ncbi:alpha/beta hydrolase [Streptomyces sp. NPDC001185]|uniref:alpha/beta hydrolase n=1 Tax=Streptomyces sp. NPDC001185 TaxID=3154380 RepID=UPI003316A003